MTEMEACVTLNGCRRDPVIYIYLQNLPVAGEQTIGQCVTF